MDHGMDLESYRVAVWQMQVSGALGFGKVLVWELEHSVTTWALAFGEPGEVSSSAF